MLTSDGAVHPATDPRPDWRMGNHLQAGDHLRQLPSEPVGYRQLLPGAAPWQPADQRTGHRHRKQGLLEHVAAGVRQPVCQLRSRSAAGARVQRGLRHRHSHASSHRSAASGHLRSAHRARGTQAGPIADLLRLNTGVRPHAAADKRSRLGLIGGDAAGFPNGRRSPTMWSTLRRVVGGRRSIHKYNVRRTT